MNNPLQGENSAGALPGDPLVVTALPVTQKDANAALDATRQIPATVPTGVPGSSHQALWTEGNAAKGDPGMVMPTAYLGVLNTGYDLRAGGAGEKTAKAMAKQSQAREISAKDGSAASLMKESPTRRDDVSAQQAVDGVLQYTLENHPALRMRKSEVAAAQARLITAGLLPNPQLMLQTASPTEGDDSTELSSRLMFTIPLGPKRAWATAAAQTGIYEAQKALGVETKTLLLEAADAAIEVMYLQEQADIFEQLAKQSEQITEIQKQAFEAAIVPRQNVVLSQLSAYNLELDRRKTAAGLNQAKVRLARAMGIPDGSPPPMLGRLTLKPIDLPPLPAVVQRAGQASPELAKVHGEIQQSRQLHQYERWNALPDISAGPRFENDLSGAPNDRMGGRLEWDLPLFDRNQGNIAEAAADIQTNCAEHEVVRVTTMNDVVAIYMQLQDAQSRAEYYTHHIQPLTMQSEEAFRAAFEDRRVSAYELNKLMETLGKMKLSDLELRYDHHRLRTRLELFLECPLDAVGGREASPLPPPTNSIPTPPETPTMPMPPEVLPEEPKL